MAALSVGCSIKAIEAALIDFKSLPHRLECIGTINNVTYYDDSKATNVDAVIRALGSFSSPVILIMGGRDKGGSYQELRDLIARYVKHLIVMGEAGETIEVALGDIVPTDHADSMAHAVKLATKGAKPGDSVLLSPACSSFDMYDSYVHRGNDFVKALNELKNTSI